MKYISEEDIQAVIESRHQSPDKVLGPHYLKEEKILIIRAFIPDAKEVDVQKKRPPKTKYRMQKTRDEGFFELVLEKVSTPFTYKLVVTDHHGTTYSIHDAYAYQQTTFSDFDRHLFLQGKHYRLFEKFGAHTATNRNVKGVNFCVWAPNAIRVSVVGAFNIWDGRRHPMINIDNTGVWELFVPDIGDNEPYLYEIKTPRGDFFTKIDPFFFFMSPLEQRGEPVYDLSNKYKWQDQTWRKERNASKGWKMPFVVYDLDKHNFSKTEQNQTRFLFDQFTDEWISSLNNQGYTYVAMSPFQGEHIKSFYAPNKELGSPESLMAFIDRCHAQGIGVLLNSITLKFPKSAEEMTWYDGKREYESEDKDGSIKFNINSNEVKCFIISNCFFWLEKYHFDGVIADQSVSELIFNSMKDDVNQFKKFRFVKDALHKTLLNPLEIDNVTKTNHGNPHSVLGPHKIEKRVTAVRAFFPESEAMYLTEKGFPNILFKMAKLHESGFYEVYLDTEIDTLNYMLHAKKSSNVFISFLDTYSFTESFVTDFDQYLFGQGNHYEIYNKLGAHLIEQKGVKGVNFVVWAPNAKRVSVVGPFNQWDGRYHTMRREGDLGLWEIFIPELTEGIIYKYEIKAKNTNIFLKTDPYAFATEKPPASATIIYDIDKYSWNDDEWMEIRKKKNQQEAPMAIYEVHFGSWSRTEDNKYLTYKELAQKLIPYVKEMGFTHIELLPITEYPYDPSWGYQVSNYYAPTSRYGSPEGLMEFIDTCHQNQIGVILDWVPAHFPKDAHALAWFDGTCLFEHADPRQGEHRDWGTLIFNYGRNEVENFLIANALFWLKKYHFDGLRVDAVASMLYLDYSRKEGEWIPNKYGGRENLEAIEFLKHTNSVISKEIPEAMMIAEESTAWPAVTIPTNQDGLGFGLKWNMGWMHDVLLYMSKDPIYRKHHHNNLTFGLVYAFSENFILSLSHDEVVHLKKSLLNKMPGNEWQKFSNLHLLYTFMYGHPGKKLLFMGGEFGQLSEWNHDKSLEWFLLDKPFHKGLQNFVKYLNHMYTKEKAMHEIDFNEKGFEWIDADNADENILSFLRKAKDPRNALVFVLNFSSVDRKGYKMGVPFPGIYREIINSNAAEYRSEGKTLSDKEIIVTEINAAEEPWHNRPFSLTINLPSLSAIILKPAPFVDEHEIEPEVITPEFVEVVEEETDTEKEEVVIEEEIVEESIEDISINWRIHRRDAPRKIPGVQKPSSKVRYIKRKPGWLKEG